MLAATNRCIPGTWAILNICGRKDLDELAKGQARAKYPGQDKMICGLEQLRIIGMLQLARKLPFVISGIRNYELSTFG
jgi:hypothetical protein